MLLLDLKEPTRGSWKKFLTVIPASVCVMKQRKTVKLRVCVFCFCILNRGHQKQRAVHKSRKKNYENRSKESIHGKYEEEVIDSKSSYKVKH